MKNKISYTFLLASILLLAPGFLAAQELPKSTLSPFEQKLLIGFSYQNYWTTIAGNNLPQSYFYKPSLGVSVKAEYYPWSFIGLSVGAGFQQRGAGIMSPDLDQTPGNADSTYRKRLRFNSVEFPISLLLRTPKDLVKGLRLKVSAGIVPMINTQSNQVFLSIEDGNHTSTDVSIDYWKNDLAYQLTVGPEINTGSGILQIDFIYSSGTKNVYNSSNAIGYNQSLGFKLSFLFPCFSKKSTSTTSLSK
ncbi:MAG: hypothetical protein ACKVOQ_23505 [Cyclobacteriaceae bacterium]